MIKRAALGALTLLALSTGTARADGYLTPEEEYFADHTFVATCSYLEHEGINRASMTILIYALLEDAPITTGGDAADIINYTVYNYCDDLWPSLVAFGEGARSAR